jgi:hypothetical protein
VKKLEGGLLGAGLLVAAWLAYGEASRRSHAGGVEREARVELVRFALGMAKMCRPFPETGARVPARLRDVSAKTYESRAEDWEQPAFKCANFRVEDAQHLQYRWLKESDVSGRVEARADVDGDGTPDTWYEVPITCEAESCQAPNYVVAVKEDGERLPPLLLRILGQAAPYSGERPSSQPGDTQPMTGAAGSALPPPPPPPVIAKGAAIPLDVLFVEAERRAASKLPSAVLLELEATKVEQRVADPAKGTELRASYGAPDGKGKVARGAELAAREGAARAAPARHRRMHARKAVRLGRLGAAGYDGPELRRAARAPAVATQERRVARAAVQHRAVRGREVRE